MIIHFGFQWRNDKEVDDDEDDPEFSVDDPREWDPDFYKQKERIGVTPWRKKAFKKFLRDQIGDEDSEELLHKLSFIFITIIYLF